MSQGSGKRQIKNYQSWTVPGDCRKRLYICTKSRFKRTITSFSELAGSDSAPLDTVRDKTVEVVVPSLLTRLVLLCSRWLNKYIKICVDDLHVFYTAECCADPTTIIRFCLGLDMIYALLKISLPRMAAMDIVYTLWRILTRNMCYDIAYVYNKIYIFVFYKKILSLCHKSLVHLIIFLQPVPEMSLTSTNGFYFSRINQYSSEIPAMIDVKKWNVCNNLSTKSGKNNCKRKRRQPILLCNLDGPEQS